MKTNFPSQGDWWLDTKHLCLNKFFNRIWFSSFHLENMIFILSSIVIDQNDLHVSPLSIWSVFFYKRWIADSVARFALFKYSTYVTHLCLKWENHTMQCLKITFCFSIRKYKHKSQIFPSSFKNPVWISTTKKKGWRC